MGLSGGRKRVKISHDPNNTHWSNSADNYGHRMLLSQGWAPGATLGAPNAAYKQHLTQASQSHIRVAMRADNLGLGAKTGSGQEAGECVGLDAFQAMLGRLNGKSEEVLGKEQEVRNDMKLRAHVERKGMVRFVYGGRLVGDDYEDEEQGQDQTTSRVSEVKKGKKFKRNQTEQTSSAADTTEPVDESKAERKKSKKRKKAAENDEDTEAAQSTAIMSVRPSPEVGSGSEDEATRKVRRKAEKAERRERKRLRKEAKAAKRADSTEDQEIVITTVSTPPQLAQKEVLTVQLPSSGTASPAAAIGRHMSVRSRYIAAKRRAVMDPQALKEILMVKA